VEPAYCVEPESRRLFARHKRRGNSLVFLRTIRHELSTRISADAGQRAIVGAWGQAPVDAGSLSAGQLLQAYATHDQEAVEPR